MDKESLKNFAGFVEDPLLDGGKLLDELLKTPFLHDYPLNQVPKLATPVNDANKILALTDVDIISPISFRLSLNGQDKIASLFGAIQACLHPTSSAIICERKQITNMDSLMIAATHIGAIHASDLLQHAQPNEIERIKMYSLYFAAAQARILGFRTSTTILAFDPEDKGLLRLEAISVIAKVENVEQLKKDQAAAIFEGRKVSGIREVKGGKFFTLE